MNLLICIGANYRDFTPLNAYARSFASECFGVLNKIIICDSLQDSLETLEISLKSAAQCLIFVKKDSFSAVLERVNAESQKDISKNAIMLCKNGAKIWLVDLQDCDKTALQGRIALDCKESPLLYLYPLGMDAKSAETLLSGIARDFNVDLNLLNADSSLEALSATNGDLIGFKESVNEIFGEKIFSTFNLAKSIIALFEEKNLKITTAESCTGGLVAYYLTREGGASAVFDGGVISYANHIKEAWLEVNSENLANFGAVSEAVVNDMLDGALRLSGADFAIATSGIAGPSGGSAEKPVGVVYIGVSGKNGAKIVERLFFSGNRNYIQEQATLYAHLLLLRIFLNSY